MNQEHYTALLNGDPDATNNTSELNTQIIQVSLNTAARNVS